MDPVIALLRNKWVLLFGGVAYLGLIWSMFVFVNHDEMVRAELLRSPTTVSQRDVVKMYEAFGQHDPWVKDDVMVLRLTEALVYQGRVEEARNTSQMLLLNNPHNDALRFQVALAMHNGGLYEEAETHFSILLKERGDE